MGSILPLVEIVLSIVLRVARSACTGTSVRRKEMNAAKTMMAAKQAEIISQMRCFSADSLVDCGVMGKNVQYNVGSEPSCARAQLHFARGCLYRLFQYQFRCNPSRPHTSSEVPSNNLSGTSHFFSTLVEPMRLGHIKQAIAGTFRDVQNNHTMPLAAGLSYYFVLSLFPLLIFAA